VLEAPRVANQRPRGSPSRAWPPQHVRSIASNSSASPGSAIWSARSRRCRISRTHRAAIRARTIRVSGSRRPWPRASTAWPATPRRLGRADPFVLWLTPSPRPNVNAQALYWDGPFAIRLIGPVARGRLDDTAVRALVAACEAEAAVAHDGAVLNHADFKVPNLHVLPNGALGVLDWDCAWFGTRLLNVRQLCAGFRQLGSPMRIATAAASSSKATGAMPS
jgi:hypothetical protein